MTQEDQGILQDNRLMYCKTCGQSITMSDRTARYATPVDSGLSMDCCSNPYYLWFCAWDSMYGIKALIKAMAGDSAAS